MPNTIRPRSVAVFLAGLALAVTTTAACFWDSDTLRAEARGLPEAPAIIVGATERFPPEYYQRRIEIARDWLGAWGDLSRWVSEPQDGVASSEAEGVENSPAARSLPRGPDAEEISSVANDSVGSSVVQAASPAAGTAGEARLELPPDPRLALESFDNLAVASDRLGDSATALAALAAKRVLLDRLRDAAPLSQADASLDGRPLSSAASETGPPRGTPPAWWTDHDYRYHANLGTVYAHRWVRAGAPRDGDGALDDLERAREHIARAIEINPDAHFGREPVQLAVIEWLMREPDGMTWSAASEWRTFAHGTQDEPGVLWHDELGTQTIDGLLGLIALGQAWESIDVFLLLSIELSWQEDSSIALLARHRAWELSRLGVRPLHPTIAREQSRFGRLRGPPYPDAALVEPDAEAVLRWYDDARAAADEWQAARAEWVRAQLSAGMHPDLDAAAFGEFPGAQLPDYPDDMIGYDRFVPRQIITVIVVLACVGSLVIVGPIVIFRRLWIRSARRRAARLFEGV